MKAFLIGILLLFSTSLVDKLDIDIEKFDLSTVYVCGKSSIYHTSKSHTALGRCKSGIISMSDSKARQMGKRQCRCRH